MSSSYATAAGYDDSETAPLDRAPLEPVAGPSGIDEPDAAFVAHRDVEPGILPHRPHQGWGNESVVAVLSAPPVETAPGAGHEVIEPALASS